MVQILSILGALLLVTAPDQPNPCVKAAGELARLGRSIERFGFSDLVASDQLVNRLHMQQVGEGKETFVRRPKVIDFDVDENTRQVAVSFETGEVVLQDLSDPKVRSLIMKREGVVEPYAAFNIRPAKNLKFLGNGQLAFNFSDYTNAGLDFGGVDKLQVVDSNSGTILNEYSGADKFAYFPSIHTFLIADTNGVFLSDLISTSELNRTKQFSSSRLALSPDEKQFIIFESGELFKGSLTAKRLRRLKVEDATFNSIEALGFLDIETVVLVADQTVYFINYSTGKILKKFIIPKNQSVLGFSSKYQYLLTIEDSKPKSRAKTIHISDLRGKALKSTWNYTNSQISSTPVVKYYEDLQKLLISGASGTLISVNIR